MIKPLTRVWDAVLRPMMERPPRLQVGALCCRQQDGEMHVLLVTSRDTGRWIIPKGWPIDGKTASAAALQEAWEEAGVRRGRARPEAVGSYRYDKRLKYGLSVPVETLVFQVAVDEMRDDFPEAQARQRKWTRPGEAANMVQEPELQHILRAMNR
ncbi:MAG: NUDIX hydrolase [Pseudomonadota bacterium]